MKGLLRLGAVLAVVGVASAFALQRPDLAAALDESYALLPKARANAADSGSVVDIANYSAVAVLVSTGQIDGVNIANFVLLDSGADHSTWTLVDSVRFTTDTATHVKDLAYRGNQRYLRVLFRATGAAGDTVVGTAIILKGGGRVR